MSPKGFSSRFRPEREQSGYAIFATRVRMS